MNSSQKNDARGGEGAVAHLSFFKFDVDVNAGSFLRASSA